MDLQPITTALTVLSGIAGMATKVNEREFNQAIIELQKAILEIQREAVTLQQENLRLIRELEAAKAIGELGKQLEFDGYTCWRKKEDGSYDGLFCSPCFDGSKTLMRMIHIPGTYSGMVQYSCSVHHGLLIPQEVLSKVIDVRALPKPKY